MFGRCKSNIALICEWGDNQSWPVSEILIAILERSVCLLYQAIVNLYVPIISELFTELEIIQVFDLLLHEFGDHISCMYIQHNQGTH